jgi:hypothetical protein
MAKLLGHVRTKMLNVGLPALLDEQRRTDWKQNQDT